MFVAAANMIMSVVAVLFIDRLGRRLLLMVSLVWLLRRTRPSDICTDNFDTLCCVSFQAECANKRNGLNSR